MTISISAGFDSGNIIVRHINGADDIALEIRRDAHSDFYQWFHFRLNGAAGEDCVLRIVNAAGAAYPGGWENYRACISHDRHDWTRTDSSYADGVLTIRVRPEADSVWIAYFAPYSMERHHDLIAEATSAPGVRLEILGQTLDGRDLDCLHIGEGPLQCWLIARQHPGESMAEWWMEGALERLLDPSDPVARQLRAAATLHIVPNMNPDGSYRGHLRTNAAGANLNREWAAPTLERSPEVYHVLNAMVATGVDFTLDVHGDEALPYNFIAGFDGIPSLTPRLTGLQADYEARLERLSPDFQTKIGYPAAPPGKANMTMSTNAIAERFDCLAMTLEMPFKDNANLPEPVAGWSPDRSKLLARDCLAALLEVLPRLR